MKLTTLCNHCKDIIRIRKGLSSDRLQMAKRLGSEFSKTCPHCNTTVEIHVDDVDAKQTNMPLIYTAAACLVAFIACVVFWAAGFIAWLSFGFPFIVHRVTSAPEIRNVLQFNLLYVDRKRKRQLEDPHTTP